MSGTLIINVDARERMRMAALDERIKQLDLPEDDYTVVFSDPEPTTLYGKNSRCDVHISLDGNVINELAMYFDRNEFGDFIGLEGQPAYDQGTAVTTHDLLPYILSTYGVKLLTEDVVLENLADNGQSITATAQSLGWVGTYFFLQGGEAWSWPLLLRTQSDTLIKTQGDKFIRLFPITD